MSLKKFTSGERLLASDLNSMVDQIEANISMIETTWSNLKTLRDTSKLIPGATYRITDYTCTTTQVGTQSAGHVFDILVTADDVNVLNENAHAIQHKEEVTTVPYPTMEVDGTSYYLWTKYENGLKTNYQILTSALDIDCSLEKPYEPNAWLNSGAAYVPGTHNDKFVYLENENGVYRLYKTDVSGFPNEVDTDDYFECSNKIKTYFSNCDFSAWELKYCLDNDINRFAWADSSSKGRGVVYYMKDEFNNECPYDFKNIQFKLVKLSSITWKSGVSSDLQSSYNEQFVGNYVGDWFTVNELGTANLNTGDTKYFYTFSSEDGTKDLSMNGYINNVYDNSMLLYVNSESHKQELNKNVFVGENIYGNVILNNCYNNKFGHDCSNNTLGNNCSTNTFRSNCSNNTLGNNCSTNTFGSSCSNNTLGNNCSTNTFGSSCSNNTFGSSCSTNTFGSSCSTNTFGSSCYNNTFGSSCSNNTFGVYYIYNKFGNNCTTNKFGNDCYNNTFGNNLQYNTFGNYCGGNTFGNSCYSNTFGNNCYYNTFGNDYIYYCTFFDAVTYLNVSITTGTNSYLQNMQVLNGTRGTNGSKLQITGSTYVTAGRAYTTTIGKNSSGTLTSKVLMDA